MGNASLALHVVEALDSLVVIAPVLTSGQLLAFCEMYQHGLVVSEGLSALNEWALQFLTGLDPVVGIALYGCPCHEA